MNTLVQVEQQWVRTDEDERGGLEGRPRHCGNHQHAFDEALLARRVHICCHCPID